MNALVFAKGDEIRASSRDIATVFEKRHGDVLRSIDALIEQEPSLRERNFAFTSVAAAGAVNRAVRCCEMDRDGFALLAMGFTGPKALKWKLAYIEAFNRMEASLRGAAANDEDDAVEDARPIVPAMPDELEAQRVKMQTVREARIAFGPAAARRMWNLAGLPDLTDHEPPRLGRSAISLDHPAYEGVRDWIAARTEWVPNQKWAAMGLYDDYVRWCHQTARVPAALTSFGKLLTGIGVGSHRSNYVYRIGLRLLSGT